MIEHHMDATFVVTGFVERPEFWGWSRHELEAAKGCFIVGSELSHIPASYYVRYRMVETPGLGELARGRLYRELLECPICHPRHDVIDQRATAGGA